MPYCVTSTVRRHVSKVPETSPVKVLKEGEEEVASHSVEFIGDTCQLPPRTALSDTQHWSRCNAAAI